MDLNGYCIDTPDPLQFFISRTNMFAVKRLARTTARPVQRRMMSAEAEAIDYKSEAYLSQYEGAERTLRYVKKKKTNSSKQQKLTFFFSFFFLSDNTAQKMNKLLHFFWVFTLLLVSQPNFISVVVSN